MQAIITVRMNGAAFSEEGGNQELARILRDLAHKIEGGDRGRRLMDTNGNHVGEFSLTGDGQEVSDLSEQREELKHYKESAAFLASCHAATLESLPKSTPKSSRKRFTTICVKAANLLRRKESARHVHANRLTCETEATRCDTAVKNHGLVE